MAAGSQVFASHSGEGFLSGPGNAFGVDVIADGVGCFGGRASRVAQRCCAQTAKIGGDQELFARLY